MDKLYEKRLKRSFGKSLLDSPVPNRKIKFFPGGNKPWKSKLIKLEEPLEPTKYFAPPPKPKPRTQKSRPPVPMPRSSPKQIDEEVKKFIDKITPYYKPEAISAFQKILGDRKSLREIVKEKGKALKNTVKSFEVSIIEKRDPAKQLYYTTTNVGRELEGLLQSLREKGLKVYVTLHITFKKKKIEDGKLRSF